MGGLFGGGSSPSKPEMSKAEKAQHAVSAAEWDHYKETYAPLEKEYLSDSQKNFEDRGRAQASSAVMREGTDALRLSALGGGTSEVAGDLGRALSESDVRATSEAQQKRDARMTGALGVGRELAADTEQSLSALGRTGANQSIQRMRSKAKAEARKQQAYSQAIGQVAGAGASLYSGGAGGSGTGKYWSQEGGVTTAQKVPESIF